MIDVHFSKEIQKIFESYEDNGDFWDFLHENNVFGGDVLRLTWWVDDETDPDELITSGITLAEESLKTKKPIQYYCNGTNGYYFLGKEDEVIEKIKDGFEAWQNKYSPDEKEQKARIFELEQQLEKLKELRKEAANVGDVYSPDILSSIDESICDIKEELADLK